MGESALFQPEPILFPVSKRQPDLRLHYPDFITSSSVSREGGADGNYNRSTSICFLLKQQFHRAIIAVTHGIFQQTESHLFQQGK